MDDIEAAFDKFADENGEITLPRLAEVSHISAHSVLSLEEQTVLCCLCGWWLLR